MSASAATGTATPAPLNTFELIDRAWVRGEIDADHAAVFKIFALFGQGAPIVPSEFVSRVPVPGDGTGLFLYALKDWEYLNPATQTTLAGFVTPREYSPAEHLATATMTPAARLPSGIFDTDIARQDSLASALPLAGHWSFDPTTGAMSLNGTRVITRAVHQRGGEVVFVDEYGSYACEQPGKEGVYTLKLVGSSITFATVSDPCADRAALMTAHAWTKQ